MNSLTAMIYSNSGWFNGLVLSLGAGLSPFSFLLRPGLERRGLRLDSESLCWTKGWENSEGTVLPAEEVRRREKSEEGEKQGLRKARRPSDPEEDWLSRALSNPVLTRNKGPSTHFKGKNQN